jgi:amidohydrolase
MARVTLGGIVSIAILLFGTCDPAIAGDLSEALRAASATVRDAYVFLHENPELGKKEVKAQVNIRDQLKALGFKSFVESSEAPTAVISILDSGRAGPVIALRAEMDARPLEAGKVEPTNHTPRSKVDGVMHNCGHDVHAALLLGTAAILIRNPDKIAGKIVFLFQPAEETPGGADDIVREGILPKLGVEKIFAQHVAPGMPTGTIAISPGYALAGSSYFKLKIKGKGSHAAAPFEGDDVPLLAARFAQDLAQLPARHLDIANRPVVISVTRLSADGGAGNVIPAEAELSGTIRAFEDIEDALPGQVPLKQILDRAVERMAKAAAIDYEWSIRPGAPPTLNNIILFDKVTKSLSQARPGTLNALPSRGMFSEDFAFYTKFSPALYFSTGVAKDGRGTVGVHNIDFDVHPDVLEHGLRLMTLLAVIGTTGSAIW